MARVGRAVNDLFTAAGLRSHLIHHVPIHDRDMADFLAVVGIVAFAMVMLGLIWGLDHV